MKLRTIAAVALAALLVSAGAAAAMPGNAPDHAADEQASDHTDDGAANETATDSDERAGPPADAAADADRRGPPADLPGPVPDHVATIHDLFRSFLGGDMSGSELGSAVGDATPDNESADDG